MSAAKDRATLILIYFCWQRTHFPVHIGMLIQYLSMSLRSKKKILVFLKIRKCSLKKAYNLTVNHLWLSRSNYTIFANCLNFLLFIDTKQTPQTGRGRSKTTFQTPANSSSKPPGGLPFITPKFNTSTPLDRSAMRAPKLNEIGLSLNGSPLYLGPGASRGRGFKPTATKGQAQDVIAFPLQNGNTLMIPAVSPTANDPLVELDENEKRRLLAVHAQIESMLNLRNNWRSSFYWISFEPTAIFSLVYIQFTPLQDFY